MAISRELVRLGAAAVIVAALAVLSGRSSALNAEPAGCSTSDPFHACVQTSFNQGYICGTGGSCTTCRMFTGYRCDPFGSGVDKEDWVMDE